MKHCEAVLRDTFNQLVVDWSRSVRDMFGSLGTWSVRFGRVLEDPITLLVDGPVGGDDAVAMFIEVIRGLLVVWTDLVCIPVAYAAVSVALYCLVPIIFYFFSAGPNSSINPTSPSHFSSRVIIAASHARSALYSASPSSPSTSQHSLCEISFSISSIIIEDVSSSSSSAPIGDASIS